MDTSTPLTADELYRVYIPGKRTELVKGVMMVREPAGYRHGQVAARLTARLVAHADARHLGQVLAAETGFTLARGPDTVRAPDAAFVRQERAPEPPTARFAELAPDLVVEVLSPGDRAGDTLARVSDWLTAGSALVWVIDPARRQVRIYRADGSESQLGPADQLVGEGVLPGFACPVADLI